MRYARLASLLLLVAVLTGCYDSYTDTYPSGEKEEQGRRKYLGIVCGTARFEYDGLVRSWYQNGTNQSAITYSSGLRDGVATNWFANGQLKYIVTWRKDLRDGPFLVGYENGQVAAKGVFQNESLESAEFFDRDGKTIARDEWCRVGENRPFWR